MITLRFACPQDAPALLDIYRPYVENTTVSFETEVPTEEEFSHRIRLFSQMYPYLVAEINGSVVGYAYAHAFHERAAYRWTVETSIYVRQDLRQNGVGKRLYTALLSMLRAQGVVNVCAVVTIPNDPSMAFHRSFGFKEGNLLPAFGYKNHTWCGVAYLYLELLEHENHPREVIPVHALSPELIEQLLN